MIARRDGTCVSLTKDHKPDNPGILLVPTRLVSARSHPVALWRSRLLCERFRRRWCHCCCACVRVCVRALRLEGKMCVAGMFREDRSDLCLVGVLEEEQRITGARGFVSRGRVDGELAVSRAIGDSQVSLFVMMCVLFMPCKNVIYGF